MVFWDLGCHRPVNCRGLVVVLAGSLVLQLIQRRYDDFVGERVPARTFRS